MNLHLELSKRVKVLPLLALLLNVIKTNLLPLLDLVTSAESLTGLLMVVNLIALKLVEMHLS